MTIEVSANHTALVEVTSHGSGGRAKIVVGHPFLSDPKVWTDPTLTNRKFTLYAIGSLLTVFLSVTPSRRQIVRVTDWAQDKFEWMKTYAEHREKQAQEHTRISAQYWDVDSAQPEVSVAKPKIEKARDTWMDANKVFIRGEDLTVFNAIKSLAEKRTVKVLMVGPSGYGKTSVPEALARNWGLKFLRWDCANVRDPEEFFGYREAVDGSTKFVPTEFTRTVREGNCIIVLDELNRLEPYLSNSLFPMLDHAGKTIVHGEEIAVGENVIFFGTINVGYQFTGTFQLDAALLNRFDVKVSVRPLPSNVETELIVSRAGVEREVASQIVSIMKKLRDLNSNGELNLDASTRVSLQIGDLVGVGLDIRSAIAYVVINGIEETEAKKVVDIVSSVLMG